MCEQINVPLDKLHKASLPDPEFALVEMLSVGAHAVNRAQLVSGDTVLVVGIGPIGLGVILFAKKAGVRVIAMDISEARLKFAQTQLGIDDCINAQNNPMEQLEVMIRDGLPTVVLDATGSPRSMAQAYNYAAHGGRLVFVGLFQGDVSFNEPNFYKREL